MANSGGDVRETYKINNYGKRDTATLSKALRKYLRSDRSGIDAPLQTQKEQEIARRIFNTYLDFTTILEEYPEENDRWELVFDLDYLPGDAKVEESKQDAMERDLHDGLVDTIAFMFLLLEGDYESSGMHPRTRKLRFRHVLEAGVTKAVERIEGYTWPWVLNVDVDFDVEVSEPDSPDIERVIDKIAERNVSDLSGSEARAFLRVLDRNETKPGAPSEAWGAASWAGVGEQIAKRRAEREDVVTREEVDRLGELELSPDEVHRFIMEEDIDEFAELFEEEVFEQLKEKSNSPEE